MRIRVCNRLFPALPTISLTGVARLFRPEYRLAALWPLVLAAIPYPSAAARHIVAGLLVGYVVLSASRLRGPVMALCAMPGALSIAPCAGVDAWDAVPRGLERAAVLACWRRFGRRKPATRIRF